MQLYGASYIIQVTIRFTGISHQHFLSYSPKINFNELEDIRYQDLFRKEYAFCLKIKENVLKKVIKIYENQKETGIVRKANCNFILLEDAMKKWI